MGMGLRHCDFDQLLSERGNDYILINSLDPISDIELKNRLTVTTYNTGTFSMIPECSCGLTTVENTPGKSLGDKCDYCHTEIKPHTSRKPEANIWMKVPEGVKSFINPRFLWVFMDLYSISSSRNLIKWLLDPTDRSYGSDKYTEYLKSQGIQRGLNYFLENTDFIMEHLNNYDVFDKHIGLKEQLYLVYKRDKDILFPTHLPLIHKSFTVVERAQLGTFADVKELTPFLDVVNLIVSLNNKLNPPSQRKKEAVVAKALFQLVEYYVAHLKDEHNSKEGTYRKLVFGSKLPWTARMIVAPIIGPHDYDEMHYPWSASVILHELHLTNKFLKQGMTPNAIKNKILHAVNNYDPDIDAIFDEMIATSPHRTMVSGKPGMMMIENRNPSLKVGSIQSLVITKIKKDPKDITKNISVLILGSSNTDSM